MRQRILLAGGFVALIVAAAPVVADIPDWDWQATFVFNSSGAITSRTLDFSSANWLAEGTCTGWVLLTDTNTSTGNTTHMEQMRVDTTNKLKGHVVQNNSNINEKRWVCVGMTIIATPDPPDPGNNACNLGWNGSGCGNIQCSQGDTLTAHAISAVAVDEISASCGGANAHCRPLPLACNNNDGVDLSQSVSHVCTSGVGLWVNAHCHWG